VASGVHGDACCSSGREKPRHGETRLGRAYEIDIGAAVRWHHTEHHGRPAVITYHNGRYLVDFEFLSVTSFGLCEA